MIAAPKINKNETVVNGYKVLQKKVVKYLAVHIDSNRCFVEEVKKALRKMAVDIKVIHSIKIKFPKTLDLFLQNIFVLSRLHYPIDLFSGLKKSILVTLNKQMT